MWSLAASVSASVAVSVLLKVSRTQSIHIDQAIAVNYPVAALLCLGLLGPDPAQLWRPGAPWWVLITLGVLLPGIFLAMAAAVRHAGIIVSDAAQRLSLLIPLAASFWLFGETYTVGKLAGMAVALIALICLIWPRTFTKPGAKALTHYASAVRSPLLLVCVWLGYGAIDILFKQMAGSAVDFSSSLLAAFVVAGLLSFIGLTLRRTRWNLASILAGVLLGCLNFGNIYYYLIAHQQYPHNPTLVFAAMNIGVIGLGTLVGALVFKEALHIIKLTGIALAVVAVLLLLPR